MVLKFTNEEKIVEKTELSETEQEKKKNMGVVLWYGTAEDEEVSVKFTVRASQLLFDEDVSVDFACQCIDKLLEKDYCYIKYDGKVFLRRGNTKKVLLTPNKDKRAVEFQKKENVA